MELRTVVDDLMESALKGDKQALVKKLNKQQNILIEGIPEFKRLSEDAVQILGTRVPGVSKAATRTFQSASDKLGRLASPGSMQPLSAKGMIAAQAGLRVPRALTPDNTQQVDMQGQPLNEVDMLSQSLGSVGGAQQVQQSPYSREALMSDIQRDPQNASKYLDYYKQLEEVFAAPEVSDEQAGVQSLTNSVDLLLQNFQAAGGGQGAGGLVPSIVGRTPGVRSLGINEEAQIFEDQRKSLIAPLARAISGEVGVLTDRDIKRAEGLLPRLSDPPRVAQQKIQDLMTLIQQSGSAGSPVDTGILNLGDYLGAAQ
jgi:hypothetical protein